MSKTCTACGAEMHHYPEHREMCDPCDREDYLKDAGERY